MSVCRKRLIYWLLMTGVSLAIGIGLDVILQTKAFPAIPWDHGLP